MNIAVLGCGPSGLIAAHAALSMGEHTVKIFSEKKKSPMPGAQYLHERIPGVTPYEPDGYVRIIKQGTAEGYAEKVYGDPDAPVSWNSYQEGFFPAWSMGETYDKLWQAWYEAITDTKLDVFKVRALVEAYDLVISTVPAPVLCKGDNGCKFESAEVWFSDVSRCAPANTIIYNGDPEVGWYRTSDIFGHESTEYSRASGSRIKGPGNLQRGFKPTATTCSCTPQRVLRMGRFGKWDKKVLVHHAYQETRDALHALQ